MQVQVIVKSSNKADTVREEALKVTITPKTTASDVKERVSSLVDITPFPKKTLLFKGRALADSENLHTVGIVGDEALELIFEACEDTFVKQLCDLLGEKSASVEELNFMFIHRHGSSAEQVLRRLRFGNQKLLAFLEDHKCFHVESGLVKLTRCAGTELNSESSTINVKVALQWCDQKKSSFALLLDDDEFDLDSICLDGAITVADARKVIAAAHLVPFPDHDLILRDRKLDDESSLNAAGVKDGDSLVLAVRASEATLVSQLEQLLRERSALSSNDLSLIYCQRFGATVCQALRSLGLHSNINRFLERHDRFAVNGGCVTNSFRHDFQPPLVCA